MNAWRLSQRSQLTDRRALRVVHGNRSSNAAADIPLRCSWAHADCAAPTSDIEDGAGAKHPRAHGILRYIAATLTPQALTPSTVTGHNANDRLVICCFSRQPSMLVRVGHIDREEEHVDVRREYA